MGFSLSPKVQYRLQSDFPFSWQEFSLPYLGINLPKKMSHLISANFPPLLKSTQLDIDRISKVENTWWGRIVLYKMLILPKILYIFRTLPVLIPKTTIQKFHKQMNNYIWQKKRHRLPFHTMSRHPRLGGMGLPNLQA